LTSKYQDLKNLEKPRQSVARQSVARQSVARQKLSEKYAGKLPANLAEELQNYVTQSRNGWDNRSI